MTFVLWPCFLVSGAAALALEMLWMRSAGLAFGQTAGTTAAVLAVYFAGLGTGAALGRGIHCRPVRAYGLLELGAAGGALWSLAAFRLLTSDGMPGLLTDRGPLGQLAALAIAIGPATACLGATLPALGQALAGSGGAGRRGGLLYALNTAGGAAGIALAGFGLPAAIGVSTSYFAAAAASAATGALALLVGDRAAEAGAEGWVSTGEPPAVSRRRLRVVAAGAGALGLGLEVVWTKLFAQVLHNSVYSFSAITLVFLVAIAAGAASAALLIRRFPPASIAGAALVGAAAATIAGAWVFRQSTGGLAHVGMSTGLGEYLARIVALAAATAGPAAFASGMVLPALWGAWGERKGAALPLGDLAAASTIGGIAGALAGGFLAIPAIGVRGSVLVAGAAYIVLADVVAPPLARWRPLGYAALLLLVVADPFRSPLVHLRRDAERLRAISEGSGGIVTVVESEGDLQLRLDNYYVLGGTAAAAGERRLGLVPLVLHPDPHHVAFVGLATGITASAGPALGVERTTVFELVAEVAQAARDHFGNWNGYLLDRPEVSLVIGDGRRSLAAAGEQFDVIVSDLFIPWHAGTGSLYSREMYRTVARRLAPGGLFCQWLPLYQLTREEFEVIVHTFLSGFPQVGLWRADFYPDRPVVGLIGGSAPPAVDLERVSARLGKLPEWGRDPFLAAPRGLAMLYVGDLTAAADLFRAAPINTDDRPLIEFMAPALTRIGPSGDKDWFTGEALAEFYDRFQARSPAEEGPTPFGLRSAGDARRAGTMLYRYALARTCGETAAAARFEAEVRALVPEVVAAGGPIGSTGAAEEAGRKLLDLKNDQEAMRRRLEAMQHRLDQLDPGKDHR